MLVYWRVSIQTWDLNRMMNLNITQCDFWLVFVDQRSHVSESIHQSIYMQINIYIYIIQYKIR
jgi:hypothetical protein